MCTLLSSVITLRRCLGVVVGVTSTSVLWRGEAGSCPSQLCFRCDSRCGLWQAVTFYGSSLLSGSVPPGDTLDIKGATKPGLVTKSGLVLFGSDGKAVSTHCGHWEVTLSLL